MTKAICRVCDGKGGWKKPVDSWLENNWSDCGYCEGYGFAEVNNADFKESSFLITYNGYRKIITDIIESFGSLINYQTNDQGKHIEISIIPTNKQVFADFIKALLKFSHFSNGLKIEVNQVFFYEPTDGLYHYYYKIIVNPNELSELDGFIDLAREWEERLGSRR